ncbi:MAG: caspase family protein [Candidatus Accumulibacter necessarius]|jgi:hypothetical protein
MNRAAVLIGVNRVRGLPALNDAVRGTHRMNDWVLSQGFAPAHVALITDEGGPVTVAAVQDAIERLLDPMAGVEQLLIYFAGHGLNINYGEFWLMNRGLERPTESVDVARSAVLARYSSVPHVIFISDACRTAAAGVQQQFITGSPIFPAVAGGTAEKAVDQFFACTLGNPALEVQAQDAANAGTFSALYTEALLEVLSGGEPTIIEIANDGEMPEGLIRPWPLKRVLREKVSSRLIALNLHTRAFQTPDARISSDPGLAWIARLTPPSPRPVSRGGNLMFKGSRRLVLGSPRPCPEPDVSLEVSTPDWVNSRLNELLSGKESWTHTSSPCDELEIVTQADRQVEEFEPLHFETRCGIKLRGGKAVEAVCPSTHVEWVVKGEILRAYPRSAQAMDLVLLIFDDGSGAMVPLLPEFIAELSFENGEWVGLAYEASENSLFHDPDPASRRKRRYLREFVLAAVERGVFQPDRDILVALVARLLEAPVPDPILLLYLAYALDDAGMVWRLRELVTEMQARGAALLFDVVVLAHRPGEGQDELRASSPGMPLLARGWSGLAAREVAFYEELANVSRMRQPGLWSRYTPAAVHFFQQQPFHRR